MSFKSIFSWNHSHLTAEFTECWEQTDDPHRGGTGYSSAANDVWSLGIMLYNLATADSLWARPTMRNPDYASFKRDPNFWRKRAPLSLEVTTLLDTIFVCEQDRISLYRLKQAVERMETFYMSSTDILSSGRRVQESARRHGPWTPRESREGYLALDERREVHRGIGAGGSHPEPAGASTGGWHGEENQAVPRDAWGRRIYGRSGDADLPYAECYGVYVY